MLKPLHSAPVSASVTSRAASAALGSVLLHGGVIALLTWGVQHTRVPAVAVTPMVAPLTAQWIELLPAPPVAVADTVPTPAANAAPSRAAPPVVKRSTPAPAAAPVSSTAPSVRAQTKTEPVTKTVAESPPAASAVPVVVTTESSSRPSHFQAPRFDLAYLDNPPPRYPRTARQMGWEGTVLLRVKVNSQGRADVIRLARSSGYSPLDEAAQEAVARWRFEPAREGEQAVSAWAEVPLVFQLHAS